mgnify:CR=1 FL=1
MDFEYLFELLCGGVVKGSIYALIALGYTMVYSIVNLINFAHGDVMMVGALTAYTVFKVLDHALANEVQEQAEVVVVVATTGLQWLVRRVDHPISFSLKSWG